MKKKLTFILAITVLFTSIGIILSSALIKTGDSDAVSEKEGTKTLSFNELIKDIPTFSSVDDFANLIDETIEQYTNFNFIELKENPWLERFDQFRIADEYCKDVIVNTPFNASEAKILTVETAEYSVDRNKTHERYVEYLDEIYRIILTRLYYSLPIDDGVQFWPPLSASMNMDYDHLKTYSFGFDETKYTAQTFVDDYKKIMLEGGDFSELGHCIQIDSRGCSIYDIITREVLFPTEEQQKVLDSFNITKQGSGLLSAEKADVNEESKIYESKIINTKADDSKLPNKNTDIGQEYDEFASLTETQIEQLLDLRKNFVLGSFPRKEMIIKGVIDENSPRLDLEIVKNIIQNNDSFEDILEEFSKIQPYADFCGGSGFSICMYRINEKGDQIVIYIEPQIIYHQTNNSSDPRQAEMELLFGN